MLTLARESPFLHRNPMSTERPNAVVIAVSFSPVNGSRPSRWDAATDVDKEIGKLLAGGYRVVGVDTSTGGGPTLYHFCLIPELVPIDPTPVVQAGMRTF